MKVNRTLAIEFSRVTEAAALAAFNWLGRGDKNNADNAAVKAMRIMLNQIDMQGKVVIGEGEIDNAPMLYIGETLGTGNGSPISIAVDPIDGTRMTAMGQPNAVSVLAAGGENTFLSAPDMFMEKIIVGRDLKNLIDLDLSLEQNLRRVASKKGKLLSQLNVITLDKPRNHATIKTMQSLGVRVMAIPDGDIMAALLCCMPKTGVDMLYGIGGAPEGVVAAAAIRALGGDMQARLVPRYKVQEDNEQSRAIAEEEESRCKEMGVEIGKKLELADLVRDDNLVFCATAITNGDLLKGIYRDGNLATTETLLIRGRSRTIRKIESTHFLDRKDNEIYRIINN